MVDIVSPEKRSEMMAGIRGKNTKPELIIRSGLHRDGFRFRLHAGNLPGKPDLVLSSYRAVIFVNGCFWHGHNCSLFRLPDTRRDFWKNKISRSRERDREVSEKLMATGWRQLIIWECAFRGKRQIGLESTLYQTVNWLKHEQGRKEIHGTLSGVVS